jgi:hypothetical protein
MKPFRHIVILFLLIATVGSTMTARAETQEDATTLGDESPGTPVPGTTGDSWTVTDELAVDLDGEGKPVAISPDGNWIAGPGPDDDFCIWSLDDLEAFCDGADMDPRLAIDEASIAWAPDSSAVAFSQDAARLLIDSDILVFDVESGTIGNLTDVADEADGMSFDSDDTAPFIADVYPAWSADSETIFFVRGGDANGIRSTTIMTLNVASGDVSAYFTISPTYFLSVYTPLHLLPDGSLLVSVIYADPGTAQNGIWRIAEDGSRIDRVLTATESTGLYSTFVHDVSADGTRAVLVSWAAHSMRDPNLPAYHLLDIESGEIEPFPGEDLGVDWTAVPAHPKFIGESNEIVYPLIDPETDLAGISVGENEPYTIFEADDVTQVAFGVDTSAAGKLFLPGDGSNGVVLTLEAPENEEEETPPCGCTPPPDGA